MRNFLDNFPTEEFKILDFDENIVNITNGLFCNDKVIITDKTKPIIEGQFIMRELPNGCIEKYEILSSTYYNGTKNSCDFYELSIIKNNVKKNYTVYNDNSIHIGDGNNIKDSLIGNSNKEE